MALELHAWPPAFALPSCDAECLAAICYLSLALPGGGRGAATADDDNHHGAAAWRLVPQLGPAAVPPNELPALYDAKTKTWAGGLRAIVRHLRGRDLHLDDSWMSDEASADCTAYSAFVRTRASQLVDLSLFVSRANYDGATRPALAGMLRWWPLTWAVPARRVGMKE
ncbi:hypothetical protein KEM52_000410 [Ascosphaera acerosa]|nr:hypothetical protein KEM52_000410 [Ascosphaera acerosa]